MFPKILEKKCSQRGNNTVGNCSLTLLKSSWPSYLVSGSFDQAVLTALSVSDRIRADAAREIHDGDELSDMLELAGMVLVQALKELRR